MTKQLIFSNIRKYKKSGTVKIESLKENTDNNSNKDQKIYKNIKKTCNKYSINIYKNSNVT